MGTKSRVRNRIRTLRFALREMTQQELADRIGVTRQTVNAIEGSKYSPSLEVAFRIAEVFGVPLEDVFQPRIGEYVMHEHRTPMHHGRPRRRRSPRSRTARPS